MCSRNKWKKLQVHTKTVTEIIENISRVKAPEVDTLVIQH